MSPNLKFELSYKYVNIENSISNILKSKSAKYLSNFMFSEIKIIKNINS